MSKLTYHSVVHVEDEAEIEFMKMVCKEYLTGDYVPEKYFYRGVPGVPCVHIYSEKYERVVEIGLFSFENRYYEKLKSFKRKCKIKKIIEEV